jgi:hypothetical protein
VTNFMKIPFFIDFIGAETIAWIVSGHNKFDKSYVTEYNRIQGFSII